MSDSIIIALIVAIPPMLVATFGLIIGLKNIKKADEIHILVNSNLSKVKADLEIALEKVDRLENIVK